MKFCPTCGTRYDEEGLRFCTKDGTPLVEEAQPTFTAMPSESSEDEPDEHTIIRHKPANAEATAEPPREETAFHEPENSSQRVVIPTSEPVRESHIRARTLPPPQQPPPNTAKVVALTILGTLAVMAMGLGLFLALRSDEPAANQNINVNTDPPDTNLNNNLNLNGFDFNANFNANTDLNANFNVNANVNANANVRTPTPKPTPSPTPDEDANTNTNTDNTNTNTTPPANTRPTATPSPPQGSPTPANDNRPVNLGVLNGRAVHLPKPAYPASARQAGASGQVAVQVTVDEAGNVTSARATSGHPLLRQSAEAAARQTKFNPIIVGDRPVRAAGILLYNFINQ